MREPEAVGVLARSCHFAKLSGRKCGASADVPVGDSVVQIDRLKRVFTSNNKDAVYNGVDCFTGP